MLNYKSVIYGIKNPETGKVVYVGRSQYFKTRRTQHLTPSALNTGRPLGNWLKELLGKGLSPEFFLIDTDIAPEIADLAEQSWMDYYREKGCQLLNTGLPKNASWRKMVKKAA